MPAATTVADLLAVTRKDYAKLAALIEKVPPDLATRKDADDTSIKDVIGHRAHWIDLFFGWYGDALAGRAYALPTPGYKWNELKRYNSDLRARQAGLSWDAACALLAEKHASLVAFLEARDDAALYGGPMPGGGNAWTPGRWAEAAGPSHYRSAAKYIRARLRSAQNAET